MGNVIAIAILIIVIGLACYHIYKERKKGVKCIGCSCASSCSGSCSGKATHVTKNDKNE